MFSNGRTITVKSEAKVEKAPDFVTITFSVRKTGATYTDAQNEVEKMIQEIRRRFDKEKLGEDLIKTVNYKVKPQYEFVQGLLASPVHRLAGYMCEHQMKTEIKLDLNKVSCIVGILSGKIEDPQIQIIFSIKDMDAIYEKLLQEATVKAKKKAEIMCQAAGAKLGKLLTISYDWIGKDMFETSLLNYNEISKVNDMEPQIELYPMEIQVKDTATFVWEIE